MIGLLSLGYIEQVQLYEMRPLQGQYDVGQSNNGRKGNHNRLCFVVCIRPLMSRRGATLTLRFKMPSSSLLGLGHR